MSLTDEAQPRPPLPRRTKASPPVARVPRNRFLYREIERFQDWLTLGSLIKRVCRIMGHGADFLLRVSQPVEPAIIEAVLAPAIGVPPVIASQVILGPTFATDVTVASPVIAGQIIFGPAS